MASLTPIPEVVPERSVTSLGVNWLAADTAGVPIASGHVHMPAGVADLAGIELLGTPLSHATLVDALTWDEIAVAVLVHVESGEINGETLLLASRPEDGDLKAVSVPSAFFQDAAGQPEFRAFMAHELATRIQGGSLAVVEGNLDPLLAYAGEFAGYVARDMPESLAEPVEPEPINVAEMLAAEQQINYNETIVFDPSVPGSIFRNG